MQIHLQVQQMFIMHPSYVIFYTWYRKVFIQQDYPMPKLTINM